MVGWNLLLPAAVAFIPFVTGFMSANPLARVPTALYWGWMVLTSLLNLRVNMLATSAPMVGADVSVDELVKVRVPSASLLLGSVAACVVAIFVPALAPLGLATTEVWRRVLRAPIERRIRAAAEMLPDAAVTPAA